MGLPLQRCHLAVLSACQSGISHTGGTSSEPVGLTSALLVAGVPRVVSSMWSVDDAAAALLITRLYHNLIAANGHLSLTAALRNAQHYLKTLTYAEADAALTGISRDLASAFRSRGLGDVPGGGRKQEVFINKSVLLPEGATVDSLAEQVAFRAPLVYASSDTEDALQALVPTRAGPKDGGLGKFKQVDWDEFCGAFVGGRTTFLYSHLFPTSNEADPDTMLPERDYWYEYTTDPPVVTKKVSVGGWVNCLVV